MSSVAAAPTSLARNRVWVRSWAIFVFFGAFAGQFWRNLLGWWGYGAVAAVSIIGALVLLALLRPSFRWRRTPKTALAFVGFATLSVAWSFYPGVTVLGAGAQWLTTLAGATIALLLTWPELLRTLSNALRWILGLSLVFELWVVLFVGGPLLPNFMHFDGKIPMAFYWSRGLLLHGGPIEGIVGNRNLLGFVALLAVIVFGIQLASKTVRWRWGVAWLVFAVLMLGITRSATVLVAVPVVAIVLGFALWMRARPVGGRVPVYLTAGAVAVLGVLAVWLARGPLLAAIGKSADFTGRFTIWNAVLDLANQRPLLGWGWTSYWAPWVEPFTNLVTIKGVTYLQAHNAWLDVRMQLGVIGLLLLVLLVGSTLWRSWFLAIDRPRHGIAIDEPFAASALLPLLLLVALLVQSLAESRLLIEGNWMLLIVLAFMTKRQFWSNEVMP